MHGKRADPMTRWYVEALRPVALSTVAGLVCGFFASILFWLLGGGVLVLVIVPPVLAIVFAFVAFAVQAIMHGTGLFARRILEGGPMPPTPQYSYPESLVARGMYEDAIGAYQEAITEEAENRPVDAEPYLRIARVYRDQLKRPEDALTWFGHARRADAATRGQVDLATREIVEIHLHGGGDRLRAIPELARLAEQAAGSKIGDWAARLLAELRRELAWTTKAEHAARSIPRGEGRVEGGEGQRDG